MSNPNVMNEPEIIEIKKYSDAIIYDMQCDHFDHIEEINLDNLRVFLDEMLEAYRKRNITGNEILDICDYLETYIHRRYIDEYPKTSYPNPLPSHPMSIGIDAIHYIYDAVCYVDLPDSTVEELLAYLRTSEGQEEAGHKRIKDHLIKIGVLSKAHMNLFDKE
jgi:hypothetical protein